MLLYTQYSIHEVNVQNYCNTALQNADYLPIFKFNNNLAQKLYILYSVYMCVPHTVSGCKDRASVNPSSLMIHKLAARCPPRQGQAPNSNLHSPPIN